jgi:predicted DNA-binding transcriptional regulator AlpA
MENARPFRSKDPLLTTRQVAKRFGVSPRQVRRLAIRQVRLGPKTIRYYEEDCDAYIKARTT